jgi:propanediol dehydratase large subunit
MNNIIIKTILKINPNAEVSVSGDDINTCEIEWHNGTTPISKADIEAQIPAVEFDMAMEDLRAKRNKDLQDSDWTQLTDNTLTSAQRNAWMLFRTELRNITDGLTTVEQVNNIDYPDKPNG